MHRGGRRREHLFRSRRAWVVLFCLAQVAAAKVWAECRERDPELTAQIKRLVADIESGRRDDIKSVDDFLMALPPTVRQSMIFIADSRSLQESTVQAPRVLVKTPNSDVVLSFGTDPSLRGYDAIEMTVWNGKTAKVEMAELRFPADSSDERLRASGKVSVEHNPQKCVVCHSEPRRWTIDPYRFWAGHIPWTEDALNKGSIEVEWYKEFLRKVESGQPRWRALRPMETIAEIDQALERTGRYQIKSTQSETTQPNNTPSLDMSHQFLIYNGCRIAHELAARPDWNKIKYAATAAVTQTCSDPSKFLDDAGNRSARSWFEERGRGVKNGKFNYDELTKDTAKKQRSLSPDREGRQQWFFEKYLGSEEAAKKEIDQAHGALLRKDREFSGEHGSRFPTFENSTDEVTKTRYLLEPLGIEVNKWSMAIDPETYSHVEFFPEIAKAKPIQDVVDEINAMPGPGSFCDKLAAKSREAMRSPGGGPAGGTVATGIEGYCSPEELAVQARDFARGMTPMLLRARAAEALRVCAGCHTSGALGAPKLPFRDMGELEARIQRTKGRLDDFGERMWGRISRNPEMAGAMPAFGTPLTNEQKVAVRAWLDGIGRPSTGSSSPGTR